MFSNLMHIYKYTSGMGSGVESSPVLDLEVSTGVELPPDVTKAELIFLSRQYEPFFQYGFKTDKYPVDKNRFSATLKNHDRIVLYPVFYEYKNVKLYYLYEHFYIALRTILMRFPTHVLVFSYFKCLNKYNFVQFELDPNGD